MSSQIEIAFEPARPRGWGGRRSGAGRRPSPDSGIPHLPREAFGRGHPVHVTLKVRRGVPSLRSVRLVRELERSFREARERGAFRLAQYSIQSDHVHLIVEATDRGALGRGMKSLAARLARAVNRIFRRRGRVLADRYHMRALRTPREVRHVLRYVLLNARKHSRSRGQRQTRTRPGVLDPASSARWFDGWRSDLPRPPDLPAVASPRTWLLREGWMRHGLLDPGEIPGIAG